MTDKSNFTPDEWKVLLESVMMAGIAVTAADPSGLWGLLKESFASSSELVKATARSFVVMTFPLLNHRDAIYRVC